MDAEVPRTGPDRPPRPRGRLIAAGIAAGAAAAAALLFVLREPVLVGAAGLLTVDDPEIQGDYLVVLGGGLETRPFTAAELYRRRRAPEVLLFEHARDSVSGGPDADELHRQVLALEGVPADAVRTLPGPVASTEDEARSLRAFLAGGPGGGRVILVTSPEHGRRARWIFRNALSGLPVEVHVAASPHPDFDESDWWKHDLGVLAYLHEYLKLSLYLATSPFRGEAPADPRPPSPAPPARPTGRSEGVRP